MDSGVNNFTKVCAAITLSLEIVSSNLGLANGNKKF